jgi:hypothetical protein
MPRIYDSHGDPMDFCFRCFPAENGAEETIRDTAWEESEEGRLHLADGNGGWGYNADHPDYEGEWYEDENGEVESHYRCAKCHRVLRARDNGDG